MVSKETIHKNLVQVRKAITKVELNSKGWLKPVMLMRLNHQIESLEQELEVLKNNDRK